MSVRVLLGVVLLLAAGCATVPEPILGPPPEGPPAPAVKLLLSTDYAPTDLALYEPTDPPAEEETPFRGPFRPALDTDQVLRTLGDTLRERGGFEAVEVGDDAKAPLRLEVVIEDAKVTLAGRNWLHGAKIVTLIVTSVLIFPTIDPIGPFLAGEDYSLTARVRWRLLDYRDTVLGKGVLQSEFLDSFAAFGLGGIAGRPWFFLGFMRVPECLAPADWAVISSQLEEHAQTVIAHELVLAAEGAREGAR